jgi:hypothetical protein
VSLADGLQAITIALGTLALLVALAAYLSSEYSVPYVIILITFLLPATAPTLLYVAGLWKVGVTTFQLSNFSWLDGAIGTLLFLSFVALVPAGIVISLYMLQRDLAILGAQLGPSPTPPKKKTVKK